MVVHKRAGVTDTGERVTQVSCRIPSKLAGRVKLYSAATRVTLQEIVAAALEAYLQVHDPDGRVSAARAPRLGLGLSLAPAADLSPDDAASRLDRVEAMVGQLHGLLQEIAGRRLTSQRVAK